jgi:glycosyltransferase involved in cell wall biosynthesis
MNIIILTDVPFPIGLAAANRILSYSQPIVESGNSVNVICLMPREVSSDNIVNADFKGEYKGVLFEYSSGTTRWPKSGESIIKKIYLVIKGVINAIKIIRQEKNADSVDCILLYSNSIINIFSFYIVSLFLGIIFVQEKNEYPFIQKKKSLFGRIYAFLYVNIAYKLCDGMMIETNTLIEYYKTKIRKNTKICRVPMTIDTERFEGRQEHIKENRYIAYCGNMEKQEGVSELIDAFHLISTKFNDVKLYLIGSPANNKQFESYKQKVKEYHLEDRVVFTGRVKSDEVPDYLCNATVLALARRKTIQAEGSLPSKVGEYLSTSNPVVVTINGEITDYLEDGVSAFLAEPDNIESFAAKLDFVLSNPEMAKEVGLKGKEVAIQNFNGKTQSKRIIDFINELNSK